MPLSVRWTCRVVRSIAYPDFKGNVQYISVGILNADDRVSMILMDYTNQRCLKIWARARIVHEACDPELLSRLALLGYRVRVERAVVIALAAAVNNCERT